MSKERRLIFLVGTGTDVGKTHVARCILGAARARGSALGIKPIETGVPRGQLEGADASALREAAGRPDAVEGCLRFARPVSPHLAAREEDLTIDVPALAATLARTIASQDAALTLVESAGGMFSPLGEKATNADLAKLLVESSLARLVLVAANRIGALHDVGVVVRAAKAMNLDLALVALSAQPNEDAASESNADELERLGFARKVVSFPRARTDAPESLIAARTCLDLLV